MANSGVRKRPSRALRGIVISGILGLMIGIGFWMNQPRWHTYAFPADPKTGVAVSFEYPDGWLLDDGRRSNLPGTPFEPKMVVQLSSPGVPGIARWWFEKVLRQDVPSHSNDSIRVEVSSGSVLADHAQDNESIADLGRNVQGIVYLVSFPSAAELEGRRPVGNSGQPPRSKTHAMLILPPSTRGRYPQLVTISCTASDSSYPNVEATFETMWSQIHVTGMK